MAKAPKLGSSSWAASFAEWIHGYGYKSVNAEGILYRYQLIVSGQFNSLDPLQVFINNEIRRQTVAPPTEEPPIPEVMPPEPPPIVTTTTMSARERLMSKYAKKG